MSILTNQVTLIGRIGLIPGFYCVGEKAPFAKLSLATNKSWKKDGEEQKHTDWHSIVIYKPYYIECAKQLKVGSKVLVQGELRTRQYLTQKGEKRFSVFVVAHRVEILVSLQNQQATLEAANGRCEAEDSLPDEFLMDEAASVDSVTSDAYSYEIGDGR